MHVTEATQNDLRQTFAHILAAANRQYESRVLKAVNNNIYKTIWKKTEIKKSKMKMFFYNMKS